MLTKEWFNRERFGSEEAEHWFGRADETYDIFRGRLRLT